ncbi:MAG: hypothetical protein J1E35_08375 [Lachnospiraceae bacterium]|nr:hypothetical protein [Lachnospiraceae bacterium]
MEREKPDHTTGWQYDFDEEYGENGEYIEETPVLTREEQEAQVKQTLCDLCVGIVLGAVPVLVIGNLLLGWNSRFSVGICLGTGTALVLAFHMYRSVLIATEYPEKQASAYMKRSSLFRMVIMLAVIGAAIWFLKLYGLFGAVLGMLTLKLSAFLWPVVHKYNPLRREKGKSRRNGVE